MAIPPQTTLTESVTATMPGRRTIEFLRLHGWTFAALVALVGVLYAPTLGYDFVNWDDPWYVIHNPLITSWHPANLFKIATQVAIKNYAPVTMLSYLVDHSLWGFWPGGYHLTNVLLHATNAVLVYLLLAQLTGNRLIGWTVAALFAVHPVHIETVAWISSRKGLLSAAFILASLIYWLRPNRDARDEGFGLLFLSLALLSKAIAVVVPAVVFLYDIVVRKKSFSVALSSQMIPGFLAVMLLLVTMSAQATEMGGVRDHMALNKLQILAVDSTILWRYVGMLLSPSGLCVLYAPPTSGIAIATAMASLGWFTVAIVVFRVRRVFPTVTWAVLSFFLFLLPVLNLFPITTLMNDRYLYLPSIPFLALVVGGVHRLLTVAEERWKRFPARIRLKRVTGVLCVSVALIVLGSQSHHHLPVWRNGLSLWRHTVQRAPQLAVVQIQLANILHDSGRHRDAVTALETALARCNPDASDRKRILKKLADWQP